jgi:hypothetical protein
MANRAKPSCLTTLLALLILGGLAIGGIKSCGDHVFAPETPQEAATRKQKEATGIEKRKQEQTVIAEKVKQEDDLAYAKQQKEKTAWVAEEAKQPERKDFIERLLKKGIFQKVDIRSTGATIRVGPTFYALSFDAKQDFCSAVWAYAATASRDDLVSVTLEDFRSGKAVGNYGQQWAGRGLEME